MFPEEEGGSFSEPNAKSDAAARFAEAVAREVRILSKLHHPNIVRYVESFADAGSVFIVMELAEGASLAERIAGFRSANARAPEPFLWDVHTQVLLALRYLESEAGVVHRDITPNNILVDRDARRVKLVDFGLAKALGPRSVASSGDANEARDSESNAAVGTMPYSAPEMIMGEPYGHKADVWSLGCVLYHAAALTPAFGGSNPLTVASQIVEGRFERLEDATPPGAYSRNLLDAVGGMLVVDPAARPSAEAAAARRCDFVMREADRAREECDRAREELRRERLERNLEASMERRRRDAAAFERRGRARRRREIRRPRRRARADAADPFTRLRRATSVPSPALERTDGGNRVKIAPERLRAVHDPATELLAVMHKLAFVDRLPLGAARRAPPVARRFAEYVFSAARSARRREGGGGEAPCRPRQASRRLRELRARARGRRTRTRRARWKSCCSKMGSTPRRGRRRGDERRGRSLFYKNETSASNVPRASTPAPGLEARARSVPGRARAGSLPPPRSGGASP